MLFIHGEIFRFRRVFNLVRGGGTKILIRGRPQTCTMYFKTHLQEEERRQREAYDKRMQELKASFLDETSQMSGGGGDQKIDINDET